MKKKIVSLCLVVAMLAIAVIGGSLAYFTDNEQADNVFTVGNVDIALTEPNWVTTGSQDAPEVYPGEALAKDPTVENTGKNPCFVRIQVTGLDALGDGNLIKIRNSNYAVDAVNEGWTIYGDYIYYNSVLAVDAITNPAFSSIVIPTTVTNGFDGSYDIVVKAEAVQAQGAKPSFSAVQAMTVEEIDAWFTTCMG
ncbi:MAG: TasA family protein [Candidatus Heteroscillospira sp.]|jgi:predicted ribosomally synthesized peptide with SipW-like signal peptide